MAFWIGFATKKPLNKQDVLVIKRAPVV